MPTGEGTGLGLSLAYDIITKEHNGTIKVESREGEGSGFVIHLPVYYPCIIHTSYLIQQLTLQRDCFIFIEVNYLQHKTGYENLPPFFYYYHNFIL